VLLSLGIIPFFGCFNFSLMTAKNIDEVLAELDRIIERSIRVNDARGIFAYVYKRTTAEIKHAIDKEEFEDNEALHKFDVAFANYYLNAYKQYEGKEECSLSWKESFDGCGESLTIIQQVLLGMNAHINLDLGLTAAVLSKGKDINLLKKDFDKVNDILEGIVNELQSKLSKVSPLFFLVDWMGQNRDEKLIDFSMRQARGQAWRFALLLHNQELGSFEEKHKTADQTFALFAQKLRNPEIKMLRWILKVVSYFEEKDISRVIEKMKT
jgi:hypothetical protein